MLHRGANSRFHVLLCQKRFNGFRTIQIGGSPASGYSSSQALNAMEEVAAHVLLERDWYGGCRRHGYGDNAGDFPDTRFVYRDWPICGSAEEVAHTGGRPLSDAFAPAPHPVFATQMMILDVPRAELARRIDQRASEMFDGGLVEEVRAAEALPGGIGFSARQAAGYAESLDLLAGRLTLSEALRRTQQRTRQLAKRQLTWLRSFREAVWIAA